LVSFFRATVLTVTRGEIFFGLEGHLYLSPASPGIAGRSSQKLYSVSGESPDFSGKFSLGTFSRTKADVAALACRDRSVAKAGSK
jgi:hypothetical protein